MIIIINFILFSNSEKLEREHGTINFRIGNEIIDNLFDEKSELDKIDNKLLEFFYGHENKKCDYNLDMNDRVISFFVDGQYYSGYVKGMYKDVPYGEWIIDDQTYECYGDDSYILNSKEKKKYEDSEGKYKLFAPKEEQYFFLTVEILISGKFYKRNYIIENDNIKKIKENSYLYFDDKFIMKMLESGKYQKLTF